MKVFGVFTIFFALAITSFASAKEDPRFSYIDAAQEFQTGVVPRPQVIDGQWLLVGLASQKGSDADGYWPEGNYTQDGQSGYFNQVLTLTSEPNAFNGFSLKVTDERVGAETKKVYESHTYIASFGKTGVTVISGDRSVECRLVETVGMFLCLSSYKGKPGRYAGYVRRP